MTCPALGIAVSPPAHGLQECLFSGGHSPVYQEPEGGRSGFGVPVVILGGSWAGGGCHQKGPVEFCRTQQEAVLGEGGSLGRNVWQSSRRWRGCQKPQALGVVEMPGWAWDGLPG